MPEKDPTTYSLVTYGWVSVVAMWGGAASYIRRVRSGLTACFSFTEFIGELVTSSFFGIMTFWLCESAKIDPLLTAAFVGMSGHMGSRFVYILSSIINRKINLKVSVEIPDELNKK
ncbi:phage holin family protein [bacterium]|nr:phage holin family protein [bacterium]